MSNAIIKKKPIKAFPKSIQDTFELLTYGNDFDIMGTASLKFKYASDIDLFERVYTHNNLEVFTKKVISFFKNLVQDIEKDNNLYFLDLVCMMDKDENPLHWTAKDIKKGYVIEDKTKYELKDIFRHKSVIKIDIAQYIAQRFVALSNWYEFRFSNGQGINQEKETRDSPKSLKYDMKKYYYEKKNYMKVLKRLFILALNSKNSGLTNKLVEVFESDIGRVYQLKSEIGTIISVLKKYPDKQTVERVHNSLELIKQDSTNTNYTFPDTYYKRFAKLHNSKTAKSMEKELIKLEEYFQDKVNKETMTAIKAHKIALTKYI
jgi:hypothetical protein